MTKLKLRITCEAAAYVPYKEIMAFQGNLKSLSVENKSKLRLEMLEYGFNSAVDVWRNGEEKFNLDGHQRLIVVEELEKEGYVIPPIPVNWVKANTEKEAKHILLSRVSQYGKVDGAGLKAYLDNSSITLDDIQQSFSIPDVDILSFEKKFFPEKTKKEKDHNISIPKLTRTNLGDIWEMGRHRVMCGDLTDREQVGRLMNGKKAGMAFMDPPYNIEYKSNCRNDKEEFSVLKNDDIFLDIVPAIKEFSEGFVFVWTTWKVLTKWIEVTSPLGPPTNMIIWNKGGGGIGDLKKTFSTDYEVALVWHRSTDICGKRVGSVWNIQKDNPNKYLHPTQKPIELSEEAIDKCTMKGQVVMDLCLGSGSTLMGCDNMDRVCYGMDLDERYCDVVVQRWQQHTGKEAVKIKDDGSRVPWSQIKASSAVEQQSQPTPG